MRYADVLSKYEIFLKFILLTEKVTFKMFGLFS